MINNVMLEGRWYILFSGFKVRLERLKPFVKENLDWKVDHMTQKGKRKMIFFLQLTLEGLSFRTSMQTHLEKKNLILSS